MAHSKSETIEGPRYVVGQMQEFAEIARQHEIYHLLDRYANGGRQSERELADTVQKVEDHFDQLSKSEDMNDTRILLGFIHMYRSPHHSHGTTRHWASELSSGALLIHTHDEATRLLVDVMLSGDKYLQVHAIKALSGRDDQIVLEAFATLIKLGDFQSKNIALDELEDKESPAITEALVVAATYNCEPETRSAQVRSKVAHCLSGENPSLAISRALVEALLIDHSRMDARAEGESVSACREANRALKEHKSSDTAGLIMDRLGQSVNEYLAYSFSEYLSDADGVAMLIEALEERRAKMIEEEAQVK